MTSRLARTLRSLPLLALCLRPAAAPAQTAPAPARTKARPEAPKVFCEPSRAVALVREQLSEAKALGDPTGRIGVMTRAADLLWRDERAEARAVFAEAFELASRHYRERGDEMRREPGRADSRVPGLGVQLPDQRFVVLRAVARRDAAWARELAARAAEETREEAKKNAEAAGKRNRPAGEKLLSFAESLLESDAPTALAVARQTFAEPATMYLPRFLYKVAESDRAAADALFKEALAAYADRDVDSLLQLSAYPFALTSTVAPVTQSASAPRPAAFAADAELQRLYVNTFLNFAGRRLAALAEQPPADTPRSGVTEPEAIYTALKVLGALYGQRRPAALERISALEGQAVTLLSPARQRSAAAYAQRDLEGRNRPRREDAFEASLEQAERAPAERRDMHLASAIMHASDGAPLEKVEATAERLQEAEVRRQVLDWVYFRRGHTAAYAGELDEARRLADRVGSLEGRALLLLNIAAEGLRRSDDRQRAEGLLTEVVAAARKAPDTVSKARALLGVARLYGSFDYLRGLAVLGEAVGAVNRLNDPDLASASFRVAVQGKNFSTFGGWPMPGLTLESSFGELGARDFEATLSAARQLGDRRLRATAVLALAAACLADAEKPEPPKRPAPARGVRKR
ncbi:MAG TPA: hypothetical protein VF668_05790 [Pyrinomonadaceae bacterium]|jgi:hypothetical protein